MLESAAVTMHVLHYKEKDVSYTCMKQLSKLGWLFRQMLINKKDT